MNTFLLRPDTHALFGDKLANVLVTAAERLKGTASTGLTAGLRQFTSAIAEAEGKTQGRGDVFDIDLFLHRTVAAQSQLEPVRKRLLGTVDALQRGVFGFLSAHGTMGDAQVQGVLGVCSAVLDMGSEMRALCTAAGRPDHELDFPTLLPVFSEIIGGIASQLNERVARLDGLLTAPPPILESDELAAARAFVAFFSVALTTVMVFASPPLDLTALFLDAAQRPSQVLIDRARSVVSGLATQCGQPAFEQVVTEAPKTLFINNDLTLAPEDQAVLREAKFRGNWSGISGGEPNDIVKGFMIADRDRNAVSTSPVTGTFDLIGRGDTFKPLRKQAMDIDQWASIGQVTGLWEEYENQRRAWNDRFLAPPHAFVAAVLERKMARHVNALMSQHDNYLRMLLEENERRNVSPEERMRDAAAIRDVYAKARKQLEAAMPVSNDELTKMVQTAMVERPPAATRIDQFWAAHRTQQEAKEAKEEAAALGAAADRVVAPAGVGLEHRPPVDAAQIASMFGQSVVNAVNDSNARMEPEALADMIRKSLLMSDVHGPAQIDGRTAPPQPTKRPEPVVIKPMRTPLLEALTRLLGSTPEDTSAVHCSSGGPFEIPPAARPLSGLLATCMMLFPASIHMFLQPPAAFAEMLRAELAKLDLADVEPQEVQDDKEARDSE